MINQYSQLRWTRVFYARKAATELRGQVCSQVRNLGTREREEPSDDCSDSLRPDAELARGDAVFFLEGFAERGGLKVAAEGGDFLERQVGGEKQVGRAFEPGAAEEEPRGETMML